MTTSGPQPPEGSVTDRLARAEAMVARTAETLSANVKAVEVLTERYFSLAMRLDRVERSLARQGGSDV